MEQRQERADKGQPRKPQAHKRKHNWQVLLSDDEHAIVKNYLEKEGIDKAFFMRRAMLKAVPKSFRTLDLRTLPGEPQETPDPAPVVASSTHAKTPEQPVKPSSEENQAPQPQEPQTPAPEAKQPPKSQIRQIVRPKRSEDQS